MKPGEQKGEGQKNLKVWQAQMNISSLIRITSFIIKRSKVLVYNRLSVYFFQIPSQGKNADCKAEFRVQFAYMGEKANRSCFEVLLSGEFLV